MPTSHSYARHLRVLLAAKPVRVSITIHCGIARSLSPWFQRPDSTRWEKGSIITTVVCKCESWGCKSCIEKHNTLLHRQHKINNIRRNNALPVTFISVRICRYVSVTFCQQQWFSSIIVTEVNYHVVCCSILDHNRTSLGNPLLGNFDWRNQIRRSSRSRS